MLGFFSLQIEETWPEIQSPTRHSGVLTLKLVPEQNKIVPRILVQLPVYIDADIN